MNEVEKERQYPEAVLQAVEFLVHLHSDKEEGAATVTEDQIEKAVSVALVTCSSWLSASEQAWLRRGTTYLVEELWDTLRDTKNRGRLREIVRGELR